MKNVANDISDACLIANYMEAYTICVKQNGFILFDRRVRQMKTIISNAITRSYNII